MLDSEAFGERWIGKGLCLKLCAQESEAIEGEHEPRKCGALLTNSKGFGIGMILRRALNGWGGRV